MPLFSLQDPNSPVFGQYVYFDTSELYELHGTPRNGNLQAELHNFTTRLVQSGGAFFSGMKAREELHLMAVRRVARKKEITAEVAFDRDGNSPGH